MRWVTALAWLAAGACNQLFDIDETALGTEAPIDPMCPAIGSGPPLFRDTSTEIINRNCFEYTISVAADRAFASCNDSGIGLTLEEGTIDGPLTPAAIAPTPADWEIAVAWLAPEGDELVVHQRAPVVAGNTPTIHRLALYRRVGSAWSWSEDISERTGFVTSGVPSAGPERRMIESNTLGGWRELAKQGGSWVELRQGTWAELGVQGLGDSVNFSPDGRRITFTVSSTAYYADRPSLDVGFSPAVMMPNIGNVTDVFLVADCEKIYFSPGSSIFFRYLQQ